MAVWRPMCGSVRAIRATLQASPSAAASLSSKAFATLRMRSIPTQNLLSKAASHNSMGSRLSTSSLSRRIGVKKPFSTP